MTWSLHHHDARRVSDLLAPESVDLIVTSPPYFALRSYRDTCEACGGSGSWGARPVSPADPWPSRPVPPAAYALGVTRYCPPVGVL